MLIMGRTIFILANCVQISMPMWTIKTASGGTLQNFSNKYDIGTIVRSMLPSTNWNVFNLPVAWTDMMSGLAKAVSILEHKINLRKMTVYSGTIFNHNFNMVCASKIIGIESNRSRRNENLELIINSLCMYSKSDCAYDFVNWGFRATWKLLQKFWITVCTCTAIPLAALIAGPKNKFNKIFNPWV